ETAFGKDRIERILPQVPLAFALDDDSSLTRAKLTHVSTVYHGLRHYYREICRYWHEKNPKGLTPEEEARKYAMIPREMFTRDEAPFEVDLLLQGNCGDPSIVARMQALLQERKARLVG